MGFAIYRYSSIYRYYRWHYFDFRLLYTDIFGIPSLKFENDLLYISQGKRKINVINARVQNLHSCVDSITVLKEYFNWCFDD